MKGRVIYEPKGKAREYSPLAVNLYTGCPHACKYCFAPGVMRKKRVEYHSQIHPREDILERLMKDCKRMEGDPREVPLCFGCDPYPDKGYITTRIALKILENHGMRAQILTKGGMRAAGDFDILARNDWSFGTTLIFVSEKMRREWEPLAPPLGDRIRAIHQANALGIKTWISVEPVIEPEEALAVMEWAKNVVSHIKVGKLNHMYYKNKSRDWKGFLERTEEILEGTDYYIKKDLWEAAGRAWNKPPA